ncbi:MlaD family protein [Ferruginibacter paludis]|uniref:MlaD family protein n=1 Tax=Ferruginibacter paludis TaxID=1310417 RepID=UPI0025B31A10|nr:MlaD family protein [Ferruginibacter paludis]MDN3656953.1 MlaD family protein [Ferruginibacter paludis]
MTISNETKVGALTAIAIVLLILGFNFLKGKNIGGKTMHYKAVFTDIQGLATSNPVVINGKQVGNINKTDGGRDMRRIMVDINMTEDVVIPDDAVAIINKSLLGNVQLDIRLGNSSSYLKNNDTIRTIASEDILGDAMKKLDPVLYQVTNAVKSLDSLLVTVTSVFDPNSKKNIRGMLENLNKTTASLAVSSASLQGLLNAQTGALAKTLDNVSSFTGALKNNNEKLNQTMSNVATATEKFSKLDFEKTLNTLNGTLSDLKGAVGKVSSKDGTLGLLLNDTKLYNNLNATSNKLNLLLDDLRVHPKRYVNISVFGKKDKNGPLLIPLADTVNAPYIIKP